MAFEPLQEEGVFRAGPDWGVSAPKSPFKQSAKKENSFYNFEEGFGKGVINTVRGAASLGEKMITGIGRFLTPKSLEKKLGFEKQEQTSAERLIPKELVTPENKAQKAGFFLEQLAEFFVPGGAGVKVAKVKTSSKLADLALRAGVEGATGAGITALQTGGNIKDTAEAGALGLAIPVGAKLMSVPLKAVAEKLPQSLVRAAIGQSKKELLAGKDVSKFVLENKRIGTAENLIKKSAGEIDELNQVISNNLKSVPVVKNKITTKSIFQRVAEKLNSEGGQISADEVKEIVFQLAPQSKGLLSKPSMGLVKGNQLRQSIDRTLGDKAFLGGQLPFNKDVLMNFNTILREEVKSKAPEGTRAAFENLSKEITLRNALMNKYTNSKSPVTLVDALAALVGSVGGVPGALAGYAVKKAAQSPFVLTGAASIFEKLKTLEPVLKKLTPAERALIISTMRESQRQDEKRAK